VDQSDGWLATALLRQLTKRTGSPANSDPD